MNLNINDNVNILHKGVVQQGVVIKVSGTSYKVRLQESRKEIWVGKGSVFKNTANTVLKIHIFIPLVILTLVLFWASI
ncbi:MAG: hypothetical protein Unbinned8472contig1000_20 [Prokaryotic dsDNA virus sp.]|nr:MAG: hypothetical protein Unbinned8472contig1000_20 [Prokaryotic dsDNA virus sp.]